MVKPGGQNYSNSQSVCPVFTLKVTQYLQRAAINFLQTEHEGRTEEYWPEVIAIWTERTYRNDQGKYSQVWLKEARLVSSLLYGTPVMLVLNLLAFENKKCTSYERHGNGPYGKLPTKKEPIRTLRFIPRLPCHIIMSIIFFIFKQTITATATTVSANLRLTEHNGFECAL